MATTFRTTLLFSALALGMTAHGAEDPYKDTRKVFQAAYQRAESGAAESSESDTQELRNYPLYPYLQAARLRRSLVGGAVSSETLDQAIEAFLLRYDREPVTRELRRDWLTSLADRALWTTYLAHYRDAAADAAQQCRSFIARIALEKPQEAPSEALLADIAQRWLTPRSIPECEQAFAWLRLHDRLTPPLIEQRARLALRNGNPSFARQMIAMLPQDQAAPLLAWAALIENPRRAIDALIATPTTRPESEALLDGWTRFARKDRSAAQARYEKFIRSQRFDAKAASPYALALALPLSWDRNPDALEFFARADAADFDDTAWEWQTRAALWVQDWRLVARSIAAMSDTNRQSARWRYWAARAAEQAQDRALARQLYNSVLVDDNYYSAMAAARLERGVQPHPEKLVLDQTQLREIQQLPALVRARELLMSSLRSQALAEWQYGYVTLSEDARAQAIHLAAQWGWYDLAVATASQKQIYNDYELLYPRPYDAAVRAGARLTQLEPELIYAVLRQESLYRADATSSAGARGLLQLLPETARLTARAWNRPRPAAEDLYEPAINVPLGAATLRGLIDRFNGQTAVALAGYNAGPNAARRWLPPQPIDPDIWVENIPYNETRGYVQRVLWHSLVFAWLRNGEAQRTESWLARIAAEPQTIADADL